GVEGFLICRIDAEMLVGVHVAYPVAFHVRSRIVEGCACGETGSEYVRLSFRIPALYTTLAVTFTPIVRKFQHLCADLRRVDVHRPLQWRCIGQYACIQIQFDAFVT